MELIVKGLLLIAGIIIFLLLTVGGVVIYNVWAYSIVADIMWEWFTPYLKPTLNLPDLTRLQFVALFVLKSCLFHSSGGKIDNREKTKDEKDKDTYSIVFGTLASPWLLLLSAWIIKWWIS